MTDNKRALEITCPFCRAVGSIDVPVSVYSNKKWGVVKIQVPAGAVCNEHQFIVLIDSKGDVRGYERIEYLKGPETELKENVKESLSLNDLIAIFGEFGFKCLLHAKIFCYPIFIVRNEVNEKIENSIDEFFNKLFPEEIMSSMIPITYIERSDIINVQNDKDDLFIIEGSENIIQVPWKEKLRLEENIISKASEIIVKNEQLIILQQEVTKIIKIIENGREILEFYLEISKAEFIDQLQKEARISKITKNDLDIYKLYIDRRYDPHFWDKIKKK